MSTMPWSRGTPSFTCTAIDRSRSVPNIRKRAVPSGIRICSSGFWKEPAAPFAQDADHLEGLAANLMLVPMRETAFTPNIAGTAEPSTAYLPGSVVTGREHSSVGDGVVPHLG